MPLWIISLIGQVVVPLLTHIYDGAKAAPTEHMTNEELVTHTAKIDNIGKAIEHISNVKV